MRSDFLFLGAVASLVFLYGILGFPGVREPLAPVEILETEPTHPFPAWNASDFVRMSGLLSFDSEWRILDHRYPPEEWMEVERAVEENSENCEGRSGDFARALEQFTHCVAPATPSGKAFSCPVSECSGDGGVVLRRFRYFYTCLTGRKAFYRERPIRKLLRNFCAGWQQHSCLEAGNPNSCPLCPPDKERDPESGACRCPSPTEGLSLRSLKGISLLEPCENSSSRQRTSLAD